MRLIKIGVASVNPTVGAVRSNVDRCLEIADRIAKDDVTLAVFPEQVIGGYAAEDLVQWHSFIQTQWVQLLRFAKETAPMKTAFAIGLTVGAGGDLFNTAAMVHAGEIKALVPKEKLPTYNVFYEARTFSRGAPHLALSCAGIPLGDYIFKFDFGCVGLEICEDIWSPDGPMRRRCYSGAEVICNLSASPFRAGITDTRREMIATRAADNQATVAYANLLGANDALVFDGGGYINHNGRPLVDAPRFCEGFSTAIVDLDRTSRCRREASTWRNDLEAHRRQTPAVPILECKGGTSRRDQLAYPAPKPGTSYFLPSPATKERSPRQELLDDFYEVLALGVADYYRKVGFRSIGLALSGGRDSLLTLMVAWRTIQIIHPDLAGDALREKTNELLHAFYMPSRFSSDATEGAAAQIARDLGASFSVVPIEQAFAQELEVASDMLKAAGGEHAEVTEIARQNIQARIRGTRMWNWANSTGALFLQTGNMSEKALGYTTVGGDLEGAFSVIANLPKTVVMAMLDRLLERFGFDGIKMTLATTAGPELAEDQSGEAELMPFEVLDACLYLYGAEKLAADEVAYALTSLFPDRDPNDLAGFADKFARLFTRSVFKWVQAPLAVHVGSLDLDRERALQLPVVQKTEWSGKP